MQRAMVQSAVNQAPATHARHVAEYDQIRQSKISKNKWLQERGKKKEWDLALKGQYLYDLHATDAVVKGPRGNVAKWLRRIKGEGNQRLAIWQNIEVRVVAFGWAKFHLAKTRQGQPIPLKEGIHRLKDVLEYEQKHGIPNKPALAPKKKKAVPILGTITEQRRQLEAKHRKSKEKMQAFAQKMARERKERGDKDSVYARNQQWAVPKTAELVGKRIDIKWPMKDDDRNQPKTEWCQGLVRSKVLGKKWAFMVLWDAMPDVEGYKEQKDEEEDEELDLDPEKWRKDVRFGWRYDLDVEFVDNFYNDDEALDDDDGDNVESNEVLDDTNEGSKGEEENIDEGDEEAGAGGSGSGSGSGNGDGDSNGENREPREGEAQGSGDDDDDEREEGRALLSILVPDDRGREPVEKRGDTGTRAAIRLTFLRPTEDERVRSIAASLNASASLRAARGDDRAAMDAYREALEILRAAAEEGPEGEGGTEGEGGPSPIQADLADTLMNVGNFHLRRDELEAARNAYATAWTLRSGTEEGDGGDSEGEGIDDPAGPSTPVGGGTRGDEPPYLRTPRGTPGAPPGGRSRDALDSDVVSSPSSSSSRGALAALSNLGVVHERRGELDAALACHERVLAGARTARRGREDSEAARALTNAGNCLQRALRVEEAGEAHAEAVRICEGLLTRIGNGGGGEGGRRSARESLAIRRTLAGALRNGGVCLWKARRVAEAIDALTDAVEAERAIVALASSGPENDVARGGGRESASAARLRAEATESAAQLLGWIGCLRLEPEVAGSDDARERSLEAFRAALAMYEGELGRGPSHPSAAWVRRNLAAAERSEGSEVRSEEEEEEEVPPPPPPPPIAPPSSDSPPTERSAPSQMAPAEDGVVDLDDIDSVELDAALATDEEEDADDVFGGVDQTSTDELDEFLSTEGGALEPQDCALAQAATEVDLDQGGAECSKKEYAGEEQIARPISSEHRNLSSSLLSDHGHEEPPNDGCKVDEDEEEMVSQLQLRAEGSGEGDAREAALAHVALAEHFWEKSDRASATAYYTEAHAIYQSLLGDDSEEVAMVLKRLGDLNAEDGALDAADELYAEAMASERAALGRPLPATLNAAGAARLAGDDFRGAMEFHRQALQIQKRSQGGGGGDKYDMYETLVRIGDVYYRERNDLSNVRSGDKGVDYSDFIESGFLGWIANAHDMRGEYVKAIQFYEESLQIHAIRKGKEAKRETALTLNRLGSLTRELGRYDEAMDYHQKALNIQKAGSGVAKAMTAETCVLMGMVKLYEDSLLVLNNALGEDHSSSRKTMAQIGSVHFELSNFDTAMEILLKAERWQLATFGNENRDTLETQALIGRVLSANGKFDEALEKLSDVCERQNKLFGSKHPTIADTLSYIGECLLDQGRATEARGKFVDSYNMRKDFFSVDQIHIAESMVDIIRARGGQPERALAIYRNAMEVYKEYLPDDHFLIGRLHVYVGDSYAELLDFSAAIERYEQAKQIFHKAFRGSNSLGIDSALVAVNIGKAMARKCDYESAQTHFCSAFDIYQKILPEGHPKITSTLNHLDRVEQEEALCV
ncbi:hypothetical protein ACHAWF_011717 [Thalassiosira exigua]